MKKTVGASRYIVVGYCVIATSLGPRQNSPKRHHTATRHNDCGTSNFNRVLLIDSYIHELIDIRPSANPTRRGVGTTHIINNNRPRTPNKNN